MSRTSASRWTVTTTRRSWRRLVLLINQHNQDPHKQQKQIKGWLDILRSDWLSDLFLCCRGKALLQPFALTLSHEIASVFHPAPKWPPAGPPALTDPHNMSLTWQVCQKKNFCGSSDQGKQLDAEAEKSRRTSSIIFVRRELMWAGKRRFEPL